MMDRAELIEKLEEWNEMLISELCADDVLTCDELCGCTGDCIVVQAIAALREQEQREWISVKEQPPERFVCVLCYCPNKDYGTKIVVSHNEAKAGEKAYFADQHWFGEVTHWMPLPEPPKEGADHE